MTGVFPDGPLGSGPPVRYTVGIDPARVAHDMIVYGQVVVAQLPDGTVQLVEPTPRMADRQAIRDRIAVLWRGGGWSNEDNFSRPAQVGHHRAAEADRLGTYVRWEQGHQHRGAMFDDGVYSGDAHRMVFDDDEPLDEESIEFERRMAALDDEIAAAANRLLS